MRLQDLAAVIRSKNASPFITTLDLFFEKGEHYELVKNSNVLTVDRISQLYKLPKEDVLGVWFVDECQGVKISFLKPYPSDHPESTDLYGAQQNTPLLDVEVSQKP